jgi:hypothetical protein
MTTSFVYAPPSAVGVSLPSAQQTLREQMNLRMRVLFGFPDSLAHQAGAKSKSSLKRTAKSLSSFQRTFAFSPLA